MSTNKDLSSKVTYDHEITATIWDQIATFVSNAFSPPLVVVYGTLISAPFLKVSSPWLWSIIFLFLFVVPPTAYVYFLLKNGKVTDFHINTRKERLKPLIIILINTLLGLMAFYFIGGSKYLVFLAICCLVTMALMLAFTLFWKISGHCAAAGGLCVIALSLLNQAAIPFTVLIPIIAWSRVRLGHHTITQTLAGFLIGILTFSSVLYLANAL